MICVGSIHESTRDGQPQTVKALPVPPELSQSLEESSASDVLCDPVLSISSGLDLSLDQIDADERDSYCNLPIIYGRHGSYRDLPESIPLEIVLVNDDSSAPGVKFFDTERRLELAESLIESYKAKILSLESLTESLQQYLVKTQGLAEDFATQRNDLLQTLRYMEEQERSFEDENSMMKFMMAFGLFFQIVGGSPIFLVAAVGFYLLFDCLYCLIWILNVSSSFKEEALTIQRLHKFENAMGLIA